MEAELRLRIAYLSNSPLLAQPANAVHVMRMCAAFSKLGHDVHLFARGDRDLDEASTLRAYGVMSEFRIRCRPQYRLGGGGVMVYGFLQAASMRLRILPDLAYARCMFSALAAMLFGVPVVYEIHEMPKKLGLHHFLRFTLRRRTLIEVVTISEGLASDLRATFPREFRAVRLRVAHDAADPVSAAPSGLANRSSTGLNFGYAGGIRRGNGIGMLLKLAERFPADRFHILGGTPSEISVWRANESGRNVWWYGRVNPADVPGFLASCDVLLAPYLDGEKTNAGVDTSRWMSPLKVFEYMASGKPIIVSDFPVLREVLSEDMCRFAAVGDVQSWSVAIGEMRSDDVRKMLGSRALSEFSSKYTWDARARGLLEGIEGSLRVKEIGLR